MGKFPEKSEIDERFHILATKIANYENLAIDVKKLTDLLKPLNDSIKSHEDSLKAIRETLNKHEGDIQKESGLNGLNYSLHTGQIDDLKSKNEAHKTQLNSINQNIQSINSWLQKLEDKHTENSSSIRDVDTCIKNLEKMLKQLEAQFSVEMSKVNANNVDSDQKLAILRDELAKKGDLADNKAQTALDGTHFLAALLEEKIFSVSENTKKQIFDASTEISRRIDSLPKNEVQAKVADPSADILKKLEAMHLDVKNSMLKNGNLETQVRLQEKKLENIYLILQKHQLSQQ